MRVASPAPNTPIFTTNRNTAFRPTLRTQLIAALTIVKKLFLCTLKSAAQALKSPINGNDAAVT